MLAIGKQTQRIFMGRLYSLQRFRYHFKAFFVSGFLGRFKKRKISLLVRESVPMIHYWLSRRNSKQNSKQIQLTSRSSTMKTLFTLTADSLEMRRKQNESIRKSMKKEKNDSVNRMRF